MNDLSVNLETIVNFDSFRPWAVDRTPRNRQSPMNIVSRVLFKQRSLVRKTHRDVFSHSNYRQQDASCFHSYWLVREKTTYQATHSAHQLKTSCIWNVYIGGLRMRVEADVCVDNFISLNTA